MVIMMINLKEKNILCNTKEEFESIIKEAINQKIAWCGTGDMVTIHDLEFDNIPVVLCFNDLTKLYCRSPWNCYKEEYFITDLAKDLLNTDREMTAHEFLNKFLDMACHCSNCQKCKTIKVCGVDCKWCDSDLWTKDNIDQVYEIVKSGNKLKDTPEQKAIDNLKNYLNNNEKINAEALQLAIKVLEEKLSEK